MNTFPKHPTLGKCVIACAAILLFCYAFGEVTNKHPDARDALDVRGKVGDYGEGVVIGLAGCFATGYLWPKGSDEGDSGGGVGRARIHNLISRLMR